MRVESAHKATADIMMESTRDLRKKQANDQTRDQITESQSCKSDFTSTLPSQSVESRQLDTFAPLFAPLSLLFDQRHSRGQPHPDFGQKTDGLRED